ncbi:MAG: nickel-dependent hydrogenase large subunit [Candidatus Aenigmatarchaeota archaeon]
MHEDFEIKIENLSKIEGHANLDIKVRKGKVEYVKLKISENKRFYTQAIRGKKFESVPQLVSRICGTCSIAHLTCCTEAVEKALEINPSEQTLLLRKLMMYGMMIRDHAMHLYLFCLPDVFGKDSVLDFDEKQHELIHHAFEVKKAGNDLSKLIGGRAIHPPYAQIGQFLHLPDKNETKQVIEELKKVRSHIFELVRIFYDCPFTFRKRTRFVALTTEDFSFLEGVIKTSQKITIPEENYWEHLHRVIIPYSQATGFEFEGKDFMVGALARMNLNKEKLHKETKKDLAKYIRIFPSENIFHNNLAQAIEIMHCIDHSIEILETTEFKQEPKIEVKIKKGKGVGVIEAPRGTLYYAISLDKDGKILYGNLVIPTAQNQIKMENDIKTLVSRNLNKSKKFIQNEIEKLIRAYDPCMMCATHFLKVNWI